MLSLPTLKLRHNIKHIVIIQSLCGLVARVFTLDRGGFQGSILGTGKERCKLKIMCLIVSSFSVRAVKVDLKNAKLPDYYFFLFGCKPIWSIKIFLN